MQKRPIRTELRTLGRFMGVLGTREDLTPNLHLAHLSGLEVLGTCQAVTVRRIFSPHIFLHCFCSLGCWGLLLLSRPSSARSSVVCTCSFLERCRLQPVAFGLGVGCLSLFLRLS